ncbi:hypothetical protein V5F63_19050 [Xanthobacter autotrophicus DSM 597]|uniref:hypothetical protein n=1 Tax=Xanthobacter wiegelii TaxID=3119913 RepID=UPI00372AB401
MSATLTSMFRANGDAEMKLFLRSAKSLPARHAAVPPGDELDLLGPRHESVELPIYN